VNRKAINREILLALWKIHILHHADEEAVVGQWMIEELRRHGYDVSPGTLYPILRRMERYGWLRSEPPAKRGSRQRRSYRLTAGGRKVLTLVRRQVGELRAEVLGEEEPSS
jgi:DNA-binding PadR family transcriptional regulator